MRREPPQGGVVELTATVAAAPADVWLAFTDSDRSAQWLGGFRLSSTWQVGAAFTIAGPLQGRAYAEAGTVLAAAPPTLLRWDHWSGLWRIPDGPANRAVMTVRFDPDGDATRVSLHHVLPAAEAIVPHARFFWTVSLRRLEQLFAAR